MEPISTLIKLAIIGVLVYVWQAYIPAAEPYKTGVSIGALIVTILWLLHGYGYY